LDVTNCGGRIVITEPLVTKVGLDYQVYLMGPNCLIQFFPPKQELDSGKFVSLPDESNMPICIQGSCDTISIVCIDGIMKRIYAILKGCDDIFSCPATLIMLSLGQSSVVTTI